MCVTCSKCGGPFDVSSPSLLESPPALLAAQVYLITELLHGGELLDAVLQRGSYNEQDARICFAQLLKGIDYLHSKCACACCHDAVGGLSSVRLTLSHPASLCRSAEACRL